MFLKRFFKKKKNQCAFDEIIVFLETDKKLSDEQKKIIITIVKREIALGKDNSHIAALVLLQTGILDQIYIYKIGNYDYRVVC